MLYVAIYYKDIVIGTWWGETATQTLCRLRAFLEEKSGKLISLKPYNDDNGLVDNKQHTYIEQLQGYFNSR